MALTDITKGMANAAQAIDANFKEGSIVSTTEGASTFVTEFGNGMVIEYGEVSYDREAAELVFMPTTTFRKVIDINLTTNGRQFADVQDLACLGVGTYENGEFRIMKHTSLPFRVTTGVIPLKYAIIGLI